MASPESNALGALLRTPTVDRTAVDYERMFDAFVERAGGGRVTDRFDLPCKAKNPDYHFEFSDCTLLLELKQINTYRPGITVAPYFEQLFRDGKVRASVPFSAKQLRIEPDSLSAHDWQRFYEKFRPAVSEHLKKAARQLKETDALMPQLSDRPRFCGLLLINSGDYNLPLDLMFRLVEWRTKREWSRGTFSKLDFVSCLTVDLTRDDQNPMQGRHIIRPYPHVLLPRVIRHIYELWLNYYAEAIGARVEFCAGGSTLDPPLILSGGYAGKIRRIDAS